jgi:glycerol-3-phosphate acyltransferase PlsX
MICHGGSNARAIKNAIHMARESVSQRINERLITQLGLERDGAGDDAIEAGVR